MFKMNGIGKCMILAGYKKLSTKINLSSLSSLIDVHPKVKENLLCRKPVVALESTIITHGMPYPYNFETAMQVEDIVRKEGSTPATIAIIDGRIKIGLVEDELKRLANLCGTKNVIKCSRRDLGYVLSKNLCGGTTVAGTLIIANMVGIKVFATGGIGGVHRDGHKTFDISADLIELGKTPIAVISSGIKSILDIPRTLEYLETHGVCVSSYQCPTNDFPAFYTRSSGCKVPYNLNNSTEAAAMIKSMLDIHLNSGILIGVPIPQEYAISENQINVAIENALAETKIKNIFGKEVTPFVLEAVSQITKGKSLNSNMALIKNNAKVASQIAVKLHEMLQNDNENTKSNQHFFYANKDEENIQFNDQICEKNVPVVIGASILDLCMTVHDDFKPNNIEELCKGFVDNNADKKLENLTTPDEYIIALRNIIQNVQELIKDIDLTSKRLNNETDKPPLTSKYQSPQVSNKFIAAFEKGDGIVTVPLQMQLDLNDLRRPIISIFMDEKSKKRKCAQPTKANPNCKNEKCERNLSNLSQNQKIVSNCELSPHCPRHNAVKKQISSDEPDKDSCYCSSVSSSKKCGMPH